MKNSSIFAEDEPMSPGCIESFEGSGLDAREGKVYFECKHLHYFVRPERKDRKEKSGSIQGPGKGKMGGAKQHDAGSIKNTPLGSGGCGP